MDANPKASLRDLRTSTPSTMRCILPTVGRTGRAPAVGCEDIEETVQQRAYTQRDMSMSSQAMQAFGVKSMGVTN
jgi:hypothetical protein